MKKTVITLLALSTVASAAITDGLQWAESFGDGYDQEATFSFNSAEFGVEDGVGSACGYSADRRKVWTTDLSGGDFVDEFTFSFKLIDLDARAWSDALSIYTNGTTSGTNNSIQLQADDAENLWVYTINFANSNVSDGDSDIYLGSIESLLGQQITLTFANNVLTAYVGDTALAETVTFTYAEDVTPSTALTGFQFAAAFGGERGYATVTLDDIGVWNRALSAEEVASLPIPEPTTATLSLLALAGLAARRRR